MVRAGVSENIAMSLSGHRTRSVFSRYDITAREDQERALERTSDYLAAQPHVPASVVRLKKKVI
jgi:hypothetical protein